jgi:hypothetical protein
MKLLYAVGDHFSLLLIVVFSLFGLYNNLNISCSLVSVRSGEISTSHFIDVAR